ncbi:MAG: hypothetical protein ABI388_09720 [Bacteroidia bacterium]
MEYIEIVKFQLKEGITNAQFIEAEQMLRDIEMNKFKGYLGRELYKCEDGQWSNIIRFDSKETMTTFLDSLKEHKPEGFKLYGSMIDFSTARLEFFTKLI